MQLPFEMGDILTVFVTIDDKMGVMFNKRRQSRDEEVCKKIVSTAEGGRLLMSEYSAKIFDGLSKKIVVSNSFLEDAAAGDYCFAEGQSLKPWENKIQRLIVFRWNRHYPSDITLDVDLNSWTLESAEEFVGKSHEKITMEVYRR